MNRRPTVVPAKAGTQGPDDVAIPLDPRFRGDDEVVDFIDNRL